MKVKETNFDPKLIKEIEKETDFEQFIVRIPKKLKEKLFYHVFVRQKTSYVKWFLDVIKNLPDVPS